MDPVSVPEVLIIDTKTYWVTGVFSDLSERERREVVVYWGRYEILNYGFGRPRSFSSPVG